jgi:hypothetical protein
MLTEELTIEQALLAEIDRFLAEISHVTLVEANRVVDFALDLRKIAHGN